MQAEEAQPPCGELLGAVSLTLIEPAPLGPHCF